MKTIILTDEELELLTRITHKTQCEILSGRLRVKPEERRPLAILNRMAYGTYFEAGDHPKRMRFLLDTAVKVEDAMIKNFDYDEERNWINGNVDVELGNGYYVNAFADGDIIIAIMNDEGKEFKNLNEALEDTIRFARVHSELSERIEEEEYFSGR